MSDDTLFDWALQGETQQQTAIRRAFEQFHAENPHVYRLFDRFAREAVSAGYRNFSAYAVAQRIRWETSIVTSDPDFKLNNNHIGYYSRLWMSRNPEHDGFFRTRRLRSGDWEAE